MRKLQWPNLSAENLDESNTFCTHQIWTIVIFGSVVHQEQAK
jgi:hypothetical protein